MNKFRWATAFALSVATSACATAGSVAPATGAGAQQAGPRVVQPGAPGEPTRAFDAQNLTEIEGMAFTEADVAFMQGMIHHHAQALEMTALIDARTRNRTIQQMGLRMQISQGDEIGLMSRWLQDRDQEVPDWRNMPTLPAQQDGMDHGNMDHGDTGHAAMDHGNMDHEAMGHDMSMPGMLSPDQMRQLVAARDVEFDRLFLQLMIQHHEGAIVMVRELFSAPGAGQESQVFQFASEVDADQTIEIRRMRQVLTTLTP